MCCAHTSYLLMLLFNGYVGYADYIKNAFAPLVADLFLFCYEKDFMMSLSDDKQADVIDAFITTSRYWTTFETLIMFILTIW